MIKSTTYCDIHREAFYESEDKIYKMAMEEIHIHELDRRELRFAYYKANDNGVYKLVVRPLDVTEDELFVIFSEGVKNGLIGDWLYSRIKSIIKTTKIGSPSKEAFYDTDYCKFYARGSFVEDVDTRYSIEQIFIKDLDRREVRFAYYKTNKKGNFQLVPRPLDITEEQFLVVFEKAINEGVFTRVFMAALEGLFV
ncbi:MAG: hypothetical protein RR912_06285 [Clostridium sp.]